MSLHDRLVAGVRNIPIERRLGSPFRTPAELPQTLTGPVVNQLLKDLWVNRVMEPTGRFDNPLDPPHQLPNHHRNRLTEAITRAARNHTP
jgi:hypothetical protein